MRFTAVQRLSMTSGDWLFGIRVEKIQCVLPVCSMRFQRKFDKYKNVGGRVRLV